MDGAPIAMTVCQDLAAVTHDPDTAKPLGFGHVIVYATGHEAASCDVP
jgi:hypothetical protein